MLPGQGANATPLPWLIQQLEYLTDFLNRTFPGGPQKIVHFAAGENRNLRALAILALTVPQYKTSFTFQKLFDMVQRRLLTTDFVNNVLPPKKGELWIADTKVRGFGLRLFASGGEGKSFCVRTTDEAGMVVRKSFSKDWRYHWARRNVQAEPRLGDLLEQARDWARREIENLNHLDMTYYERRDRSRSIARLVGKMTLERAARSLLRGMLA